MGVRPVLPGSDGISAAPAVASGVGTGNDLASAPPAMTALRREGPGLARWRGARLTFHSHLLGNPRLTIGSTSVVAPSQTRPWSLASQQLVIVDEACWPTPATWPVAAAGCAWTTRELGQTHRPRLLREFAAARGVPVIDLDDPEILNAVASNPTAAVSGPTPCVDEYQRAPALLDAIKARPNRESTPRGAGLPQPRRRHLITIRTRSSARRAIPRRCPRQPRRRVRRA